MLKQIIYKILSYLIVLFYRSIYGIDKKKAVFRSFSGKSYSCNPKAISEKLHEIAPDIKIVWLFNEPLSKTNLIPDYVIPKKNTFINRFKEISTAGIYIENNGLLNIIKKSKKQLFIQTWHGDRGFKKILLDSIRPGDKIIKPNESKPGYCDYMLCGSDYAVKSLRSSFGYKGKILLNGTPRNDCLVKIDYNKINIIKEELCIPQKNKILLYAPTFRDTNLSYKSKIKFDSILNMLSKQTNTNWICLLRLHPVVKNKLYLNNQNYIDVSNYEDMADLLMISDLLITDYSSSAGDFVLINKPVILYQEDYKIYLEKDRDFYFDMKITPFLIANNQNELEKTIEHLPKFDSIKNCEAIKKFYGTHETGKSSEIISNIIKKWVENSK